MKILIIGGNGFIGKNLIEFLSNEYEIYSPTSQELNLLDEQSVRNFLKINNFDVIVFSAINGGLRNSVNSEDLVKTNLRMFFNIVNNSNYFKKMIFLGSGAEYDKIRDLKKVKETDFGKSIPRDNYGFYKFVCSKYIENSDKIINLRLFGVYGKYEDYNTRFISNIVCRILFGLPVEMNQNLFINYVSIEDLCKIIKYFIDNKNKWKNYNVCSNESLDLLTIAKKIIKISERDVKLKIKKEDLGKEYSGDNSLLMNELKNFEFISMDEGIKKLYWWYENNKSKINSKNLLKF